ncbi:sirohydrochlorin chelatase [Bacillus sp. 165]|uniref:sirohydrochlorin chelatase n=1 Tax=Bacillus sp. 165 TaxID=1529117 RepID=UPI001ADBABEE|nr:sirohydrochlorin chelatase [Bacillus sp. 165]MBO9128339.1 sirohydrochlorin chelatase [Bacillus sp. 165]
MQAVLYVCHGSRLKEACNQATTFVQQCIKKMDIPIQEISFLELASPSIAEGFANCIAKGATQITVIPVLLLTAAHAKTDIPQELMRLNQEYPHIAVTYGRPFNVHAAIIPVLLERIQLERVGKDAMILLVGRGSRDPDVKHDLEQIACLLQESGPFQRVETCYLAACSPTFEEGLERAAARGHRQVFVVPYLLFTGLLIKGMERMIHQLKNDAFILCPYLGYHPNLQKILAERVEEAIRSANYVSYFSTHTR